MDKVFGTQSATLHLFEDGTPRNRGHGLGLLSGDYDVMPSRGSVASVAGDQFRVLNLVADANGQHAFRDPHDTLPALAGTDALPDVKARIELVAFSAGGIAGEKTQNATLRLDVAQDEQSPSPLQPLFWSIAAGLDLAALFDANRKDAPKNYRHDFQRSFGQRPIEIGGGIAKIRFEVVAHESPPWWRQIFTFAKGRTGKALIHALGFPGILSEAVDLVDNALNQFDRARVGVLFQSAPMTFALTARAREEYTLGSPGVSIGSLNQGFSLLVPHRHFQRVLELRPRYLATFGRLLPADQTAIDMASDAYVDPFAAIPYAVLRIKLEQAALSSNL